MSIPPRAAQHKHAATLHVRGWGPWHPGSTAWLWRTGGWTRRGLARSALAQRPFLFLKIAFIKKGTGCLVPSFSFLPCPPVSVLRRAWWSRTCQTSVGPGCLQARPPALGSPSLGGGHCPGKVLGRVGRPGLRGKVLCASPPSSPAQHCCGSRGAVCRHTHADPHPSRGARGASRTTTCAVPWSWGPSIGVLVYLGRSGPLPQPLQGKRDPDPMVPGGHCPLALAG